MNKGLKASILAFSFVLFASFAAADTTSADTVNYDSNSEFFSGKVLQVGYISNFATDKIDVYLGQDKIEESTGAVAGEDLRFSVSHQETYAKYGTLDSGLPRVFKWEAVKKTVDSKDQLWSWTTANCADINDGGEFSVEGYGSTDVNARAKSWTDFWTGQTKYDIWCFRKNGNYGAPADISSPDEIFRTEWQVQAGDKSPQTAVITNGAGGDGVVSSLGRYAKVKWQGSLSTGETPPDQSNVLALHSNSYEDNWRVISDREYNEYQSFVQNSGPELLKEWSAGRMTESYVESQLNNKAEQAASEFSESPLAGSQVLDSSFESGAFKVDMDRSLAYPQFNLYVKAGENGYISVYKPVGKPDIVGSTGAEFGELGEGTVSVDVKNIGGAEGSFSARIDSCGQYFSGNSLQDTQRVSPGNTATFDFRVSFTSGSLTQSKFSDQCSIVVEDTGSGEEVSTSVEVTATQESECTEGDETKREIEKNGEKVDAIYVCSNGLQMEQGEVCGPDEEARFIDDSVQWECRDKDSTGGSSGLWTVPGLGWQVDNPTSAVEKIWNGNAGALTWTQILLTFIGFLAGFALVGIKLGKVVDGLATEFIPVSDAIVRLGIGLVGGVLTGMAVYQFVTDPVGLLVTFAALILVGYLYVKASTPEINL